MKIVQINCTFEKGSTGRIAAQLQQAMNQEHIENAVVFGYGPSRLPGAYSVYSKLGSHLHSFLSRRFCMQGLGSWIATKKAVAFLKRHDPDIVHLHNIHGHYLNYPLLFRYLKQANKKVVWTFHDCWPFTGKCAHYADAKCDRWQTGCHHCPNLSTYPDSTCDRSKRNYAAKRKWFNSLSDLHIVCNSDWLRSQVALSFLKPNPLHRIYNGVDTAAFYPCGDDTVRRTYGIPEDAFLILAVSGVWKASKGFDTMKALADAVSSDTVIVMVGLTPEQIEALPDNIIGIPRTENVQALAALYSSADLLINPSTEETFGMVVAEAMACGTPAIVSNQTACPEIVTEQTGAVVDMSCMADIIKAIEAIRQKGKDHYACACVEHVKANYTVDRMCAEYLDLYREMISDNRE